MEIKEIEKLSLKPDDVILLRFDVKDYDREDMQSFYEHLSSNVFQHNEVIFLPSNIDFSVISQSKFLDMKKYFGDF